MLNAPMCLRAPWKNRFVIYGETCSTTFNQKTKNKNRYRRPRKSVCPFYSILIKFWEIPSFNVSFDPSSKERLQITSHLEQLEWMWFEKGIFLQMQMLSLLLALSCSRIVKIANANKKGSMLVSHNVSFANDNVHFYHSVSFSTH